jgi:hypothetical protein
MESNSKGNQVEFSISVTPHPGEVLSSYIIRMAIANHVEPDDIIRYFYTTRIQSYQIDIIPCLYGNLGVFAKLLHLTENDLQNMTFTNVQMKFNGYIGAGSPKNGLTYLHQIGIRKVCPICMSSTEPYYKLIWLVREVEICLEHKVRLVEQCTHCQSKFQYINPTLTSCLSCGRALSESDCEIIIGDLLIAQERIYKDWLFLFSPSNQLASDTQSLDTQRALTYKFLYFLSMFDANSLLGNNKSRQFRRGLVRFVLNIENDKAKDFPRVSITNFLQSLRHKNFTIDDFIRIEVPESFYQSLQQTRSAITPEECLSPWCADINKSSSMIRIDRSTFNFLRRKYSVVFICESCLMKFGKGKDIWEEISGDIQRIQEILPLVSQLYSKARICNIVGISERFAINRLLGYMLYHGLIPTDSISFYVPKRNNDVTVEMVKSLFMEIYPRTKNMRTTVLQIKNKLNLDLLEVYYYLAHHELVLFLHSNTVRSKKGEKGAVKEKWTEQADCIINEFISKEVVITVEQVAASMNVSQSYLASLGVNKYIRSARRKVQMLKVKGNSEELLRRVQEEFIKLIEKGQPIYMYNLYNSTGIRKSILLKRYPQVYDYIHQVYHQEKERQLQVKLARIKDVVTHRLKRSLSVTIKEVAKEAGIHERYFHQYAIYKNTVKEIIDQYQWKEN